MWDKRDEREREIYMLCIYRQRYITLHYIHCIALFGIDSVTVALTLTLTLPWTWEWTLTSTLTCTFRFTFTCACAVAFYIYITYITYKSQYWCAHLGCNPMLNGHSCSEARCAPFLGQPLWQRHWRAAPFGLSSGSADGRHIEGAGSGLKRANLGVATGKKPGILWYDITWYNQRKETGFNYILTIKQVAPVPVKPLGHLTSVGETIGYCYPLT